MQINGIYFRFLTFMFLFIDNHHSLWSSAAQVRKDRGRLSSSWSTAVAFGKSRSRVTGARDRSAYMNSSAIHGTHTGMSG